MRRISLCADEAASKKPVFSRQPYRIREDGRTSRLIGLCVVTALVLFGATIFASPAAAQQCAINVPRVNGQWRTLPYLMPINPISATLLHTGKVLIVAGSENDAKNNSAGSESYRNAIWDPTGTTQSSITVQDIDYDVFCSGTAALPDGRALVVGGTSEYVGSTFTGDNRASIFDPLTASFVQSQSMVDGRWYATTTALGDGRVMTFSGIGLNGETNNTVEIYDLKNAGAGWTSPVTAPFPPPLYPYLFLLPNGNVFWTGHGTGSTGYASGSWMFDVPSMTWARSAATTIDRYYGAAVLLPLLPPSYTPKVINFGGGNPATNTTEIIDLSVASPSYIAGPNMSTGRVQNNAVILPTGKVLVSGGSINNESPNQAGKAADLYDPVANAFRSAGAASYSRLYHSVALLLPDATVASMGSNPGPRGNYEPAIEIYTPAYLFDASNRLITNRPTITGAPAKVGYGAPFSVTYTSASAISSAVLIRLGSTTHTNDMDQRLIGLCGPAPQPPCSGSGTLNLTSPPSGNIAPPGYYMLFLLDGTGVPSKAKIIQISPYATTPPIGSITSPASDMTIHAGDSLSFGTTSAAAKYSWIFPGGTPDTSTAQNPATPVQFQNPGEYVVSLTLIDGSGNSDPSPDTRTITVLPTSPDFSIAVSPSSNTVLPGQSATFTVTVTPLSGFNGAVTLGVDSENGFGAGVTSSGFSPASIMNGSGSSTLTMRTTTSANPNALSLTITGTAGTLAHTAATTLLVQLAPPASLAATAGNAQVALSWPASVSATNYHVKRALFSGGPYTTVACATATNYTDTGLTNGTSYYYVVSAGYSSGFDGGGESVDSSEASATPQGAPLAPTGLTATPGNTQVALSWTASAGATSYNVKRATVSGGPYTIIAGSNSTSYTDTGLTNGTTYYYVVTAVNSIGESGNSSQVSATPQAVPTPTPTPTPTPAPPTATPTMTPTRTPTSTPTPVPPTATPTNTPTRTPTSTPTPAPPTATPTNTPTRTPTTTPTPAPVPLPPTSLTAASGPARGGISLRWTQSTTPGVTQNRIYRRTSNGSYPSTPRATISASTSYADSKLSSGTGYCYEVTAVNSGGESTRSNEACATAK